jgi:uncharacterized sulfatase
MISAMDDGVGLITNTLKKCGLTERTLLFFIGDNGAPLKIHQMDSPLQGDPGGWDGSLNTPLNGEKGMLSEGGMSTPFVVAWPGKIPGGQIYDHPITALDVAATAAAIASISVPQGELDGVNIIPHLTGETKSPPHDALYWRWSAQSAIRENNWKLLRGGEREYLYDLSTDREERHNLASKHPDVADRLRGKLKSWADSLNPPGLALSPMAKTWNDYFDHYLEGKKITAPSTNDENSKDANAETQGWLARNGTLISQAGSMVLTPEKGKAPFIAKSSLKLKSPLAVKIKLMNVEGGPAVVAWRVNGEKDFSTTNRMSFAVPPSNDWQTHEVKIPDSGANVIHLRIQLPNSITKIESILLNSK